MQWLNTAVLSNYSYTQKREIEEVPSDVQTLNWLCTDKAPTDQLEKTIEAAKAALYSRDLANTRGSVATPAYMSSAAMELYSQYHSNSLDIEVMSGSGLQAKGLRLLYGVGQGAVDHSRLITLSYHGAPTSTKRLAIVGKSVTFDTGGLNLKTGKHMEDMHLDKAGACAALGVMRWVLATSFPVNLVVCLAAAENSIGQAVFKPGDILTSLSGKTVEIKNTDAEGRLALADAITYTQQRHKPDTLIDLATLTGSVVVALGERTAGVFGNHRKLLTDLIVAGKAVDEDLWELPITQEYRRQMKGKATDLVNDAAGRCGAGQAAAFLEAFVRKKTHWAHIDLAGPATPAQPHRQFPKGATGFGTQLLIRYLQNSALVH